VLCRSPSPAPALGLRQSEVPALQWADIDLLDGALTVRRSIHRADATA
jgi:integrase